LRPIVEDLQWRVARSLLESGADVVLENGFWHRQERLERVEEARAVGARVVLHLLDAPPDELKRRVEMRNRTTEARSLKITPEEIDRWLGYFQPPDADELKAYDAVERG
jgi:predicted kinase